MQLTKNSEYSVSQNAPKCTQLTKIDQNSENVVYQIDQNELLNLLKLTKMNQWEG